MGTTERARSELQKFLISEGPGSPVRLTYDITQLETPRVLAHAIDLQAAQAVLADTNTNNEIIEDRHHDFPNHICPENLSPRLFDMETHINSLTNPPGKRAHSTQYSDPDAVISSLSNIRSVAQQIYSTNLSRVQPHLIPPSAWWKEKPKDIPSKHDSLLEIDARCGLERYLTMGRRQPIHITYHPNLSVTFADEGPSSSQRLFDLLQDAGLECSLEDEYELGDEHQMLCALAVLTPVSHDYVKTSRFQRTLEMGVRLGKWIIPVLVKEQNENAGKHNMLDDIVVGPTLRRLRCIHLSHILSMPEILGSDEKGKYQDGEWNRLMKRLHTATGANGPTCCKDAQIFISYCPRNSEMAMQYGTVSSFVGAAWADPRKVKDELESKKGKACWIDYENSAALAKAGLFHGVHVAMEKSALVIICMSNEYMSSEICRNELQNALAVLKKPAILVLVGTAESVERGGRWDKSSLAHLLQGVPYVDMRRCQDKYEMDKKVDELNMKIHAKLGLEDVEKAADMRVRISRITMRKNPLLLDASLAFYLKLNTTGDTSFKCKTHISYDEMPPENPTDGVDATGKKGGNKEPAEPKPVKKDPVILWNKDKVKFDCKVDESVRVKVFCTLKPGALSASVAPAVDVKEKNSDMKAPTSKIVNKKNTNQDKVKPESTPAEQVSSLVHGEAHFVGEAVLRVRPNSDSSRSKDFSWHSLTYARKGEGGVTSFGGEIGFQIETVDFSAARAPKPPPQVSHIECQTDLKEQHAAQRAVREVAKKAEAALAANPSENLLPRKVSRFVDKLGPPLPEKPVRPKLGLSKGYGWYQSSTAGISTPRKLLPTELSPGGSRSQMMPGLDSTTKPADTPQEKGFRSIASRYEHLYDFDATKSKPKERNGYISTVGQDEEDPHWQKIRTSIDVLMGGKKTSQTT